MKSIERFTSSSQSSLLLAIVGWEETYTVVDHIDAVLFDTDEESGRYVATVVYET